MGNQNFWTENKNANLEKLKKLIKINPNISNTDIAQFFGKSICSIEAVKRRNAIKQPSCIKQLKEPTIINSLNSIKPIKSIKSIKPINWHVETARKGALEAKPFKTYLVSADQHIPHEDEPAITSILSLMDDIVFDGFILLGDYLDFTPISHWLHDKKSNKTLENLRMKQDYIEGNKLLDEFDRRLPEGCDKRYFYGNHERFYYDLIEKMPALEGLLDPQIELKLKERGYIVYDKINHIERLGRLALTHGQYHNQNYVLKHIQEFKTNVLHADLHSPRMRFENSPAKELAIAGYCLGCLCNMNPTFMKNRAHKWSHGFCVLYLYEDGYFDIDLKRIVKGKFVYNNKLYSGNK